MMYMKVNRLNTFPLAVGKGTLALPSVRPGVPYDERDDRNRFVQTYSDADFLEAVAELEIAAASDVGDEVGCTTENARVRLNKLVDQGDLEKRRVGQQDVFLPVE